MEKKNIILELEGNANDLLMVDEKHSMKSTCLIWLNPESDDPEDEVVDIRVTSTNVNGEHKLFDKILGKKIKLTLTVEE